MARRTKEDAQATRTALLDAAERVFQLRGVSRTSLSDIAQAAGVTRGALYWHFKDKAALFNAMMERVTLPLEGGLCLSGAAAAAADPVAEMRQGLVHALRQIARDEQTRRVLEIATMMVEHIEELSAVRERHLQAQREHVERLRTTLEEASRQRGCASRCPCSSWRRACMP
ncbi:TetR family transcriptional regulator [Ottowia sp. VDI28]|uniref:TetR family transcriptional regulator n=1 Tax=Ottowia sp. VDI28 TaxID=3133968 RepID=UPI003C2B1085